jgi:Abortive infection alpha
VRCLILMMAMKLDRALTVVDGLPCSLKANLFTLLSMRIQWGGGMSDDNDAITSVAKTATTALETAQQMGAFISRFVSVPLEQAMGLFADKLAYHRWENQVRLQMRAEEFVRAVGWNGPDKAIPLKLAVPLLSASTLEDDPVLQDMWARLLVNASCSQSGIELQRSYIDVLESMSPTDAQILNLLCISERSFPTTEGWWTGKLPESASPYVHEQHGKSDLPSATAQT